MILRRRLISVEKLMDRMVHVLSSCEMDGCRRARDCSGKPAGVPKGDEDLKRKARPTKGGMRPEYYRDWGLGIGGI